MSGTTSLVIRDAMIDGVHARYGYFCDLRTLPSMERATWVEFARHYYEGVRYAPGLADAGHPKLFLTAVIDSNERALRLLRNRLPGLVYRSIEPYQVVQAFFSISPVVHLAGAGVAKIGHPPAARHPSRRAGAARFSVR